MVIGTPHLPRISTPRLVILSNLVGVQVLASVTLALGSTRRTGESAMPGAIVRIPLPTNILHLRLFLCQK
jgi:hypothetical protein